MLSIGIKGLCLAVFVALGVAGCSSHTANTNDFLPRLNVIKGTEVRLLVTAKIKSKQGSRRFRYLIRYIPPNYLKIDLMPMFGAYALRTFEIRGGKGYALGANGKVVKSYGNSRELIKSILGVGLDIRDLLFFLFEDGAIAEIKRIRCKYGGMCEAYLDVGTEHIYTVKYDKRGFISSYLVRERFSGQKRAKVDILERRRFASGYLPTHMVVSPRIGDLLSIELAVLKVKTVEIPQK